MSQQSSVSLTRWAAMNSSLEHSDLQVQFTKLVNGNSARWMGIARSYANLDDRDDLLQDILLQVWKSLPSFRGDSKIETWSYRVALNTALAWNRTRKNQAEKFKRQNFELFQIERSAETYHEEINILEEFLASLSKSDRAVMLLHLENVPNQEAAEILGIKEGTLRVRTHRIKQKFESQYIQNVESQQEEKS